MTSQLEKVEPIFKVELPLTRLKEGFGYEGVILKEKETGKLQCHVCGKFFEFLSGHIFKGHKLKLEAYKKKFGLPLKYPLCSKSMSMRLSEQFHEKFDRLLKNLTMKGVSNNSKKRQINAAYGQANPAWKNIHGSCDEQLKNRFLNVADIVERTPSKSDLRKHDKGLDEKIARRFGSFNKFKRLQGYSENTHSKKISATFLLTALRKFYQETKRLPRCRDFQERKPYKTLFYKRFGSWRKALIEANLLK